MLFIFLAALSIPFSSGFKICAKEYAQSIINFQSPFHRGYFLFYALRCSNFTFQSPFHRGHESVNPTVIKYIIFQSPFHRGLHKLFNENIEQKYFQSPFHRGTANFKMSIGAVAFLSIPFSSGYKEI